MLSFSEVLWPKRSEIILTTEILSHWNSIPLFCCIFSLADLFKATSYSIFQGKSALWSHLLQYQEREEKQEHSAESPGEYSAVHSLGRSITAGELRPARNSAAMWNPYRNFRAFACWYHVYILRPFVIIMKLPWCLDKIAWCYWREMRLLTIPVWKSFNVCLLPSFPFSHHWLRCEKLCFCRRLFVKQLKAWSHG